MLVGIAGSGVVAQALGRALQRCGATIACVASRDPGHAEAAGAFLGSVPAVRYEDVGRHASHVVLAVSDRAITSVAEQIARAGHSVRIALHTCGSYGPELLEPLRLAGASCGVLHPMQTMRDPLKASIDLRDACFGVSGQPEALIFAKSLATIISGRFLEIEDNMRPLYHAAAVMASNYVVALIDAAEELLSKAGVTRESARCALGPLIRASVANALETSPVNALTGPVVRGDADTVASHIDAISAAGTSLAELYRSAGLHALRMAETRELGAENAQRLRTVLLGRE